METPKVHLQAKHQDKTNQTHFIWNPYLASIKEIEMNNKHLVDAVSRLEVLCEKMLKTIMNQKSANRNRFIGLEDHVLEMHDKLREASLQQEAIHEEIGKQGETVIRLRQSIRNHRMSMNEFTLHQYDDLHDVLDMLDRINAHNSKMGIMQEEVLEKLESQTKTP